MSKYYRSDATQRLLYGIVQLLQTLKMVILGKTTLKTDIIAIYFRNFVSQIGVQ